MHYHMRRAVRCQGHVSQLFQVGVKMVSSRAEERMYLYSVSSLAVRHRNDGGTKIISRIECTYQYGVLYGPKQRICR